MEYEKDGYSWQQDERLEDLINPVRIKQIKEEYIKKTSNRKTKSPYLIDNIEEEEEGVGCAACFV